MKTSVRIGAFEIDDGELHGESPGDRTLTIPCKSDPDLCMQLDAWDAETSIPALLNGEHSVLYRTRYDQQSVAWLMRLACSKKNPSAWRVICPGYSPVVKSLLNLTVRHHTSGMKCSRWYFLFATWMAVVKILLWMSTTRNSSVFIL